jgi:hypothetical protein
MNLSQSLEEFAKQAKEIAAAPIFPSGHEHNPKGGKFDIEPNGKFSKRTTTPRVLVIHWGSNTAETLARYFRTTTTSVSAHWAVDENGCFQMLDHQHRAFHAGWINNFSVGFDIACSPLVSRLELNRNLGRDMKVIDNPTYANGARGRGERKCLSLDPVIARNARWMTFYLCNQLGIPLEVPRDASGKVRHDVVFRDAKQLGNWTGVIGHHHCDAGKWDIAPWWGSVFDGTPLGD